MPNKTITRSINISPYITVVQRSNCMEIWFYEDKYNDEATSMISLKPDTARKLAKALVTKHAK